MNIKLKTTTRTPYSEEIVIFDTDNTDENGEAVSIGKLDVHYLEDQIVGTLLIWQEYATGFSRVHGSNPEMTMDTLIDQILLEVSEPVGIPSEYGVEVYYPTIANQGFFSNYSQDDETADDGSHGAVEGQEHLEYITGEDRAQQDDDFAKKLQSRP